MKSLFTLLLLIIAVNIYSQDKIYLKTGDNIEAKILEINIDDIKYKKLSNLEGPIYTLLKREIHLIVYQNGESQIFNTNKSNNKDIASLEETRDFIIENINKHGYWENSNYKRYKASFQGDYLILVVLNNRGANTNNVIMYDFLNVYKFGEVDKRNNGITFLNIWVSILKGRDKNIRVKHKLVLRVKGHENAVSIYQALKHYNNLLIEKRAPPNRFN